MILLPLLIGQAFACTIDGRLDLAWLLAAALFGLLFQVHLLYINDYSDEATDRLNSTGYLSGGSRVLPEGQLQADQLLFGARIVLALLASWTLVLAFALDRPGMLLAGPIAVLLSWAYHRPPLRLSYRGRGEFLQGLGCGILLPLIGFYLQRGTLDGFPWSILVPLYLLFHAGNIVTALPDRSSDHASSKRTVPVRYGERRARFLALGLVLLSALAISTITPALSGAERTLIAGPAVLVLAGLAATGLMQPSEAATLPTTRAFVSWVSLSQAWLLCAWIAALLIGNEA